MTPARYTKAFREAEPSATQAYLEARIEALLKAQFLTGRIHELVEQARDGKIGLEFFYSRIAELIERKEQQ